MAAKSGDAEEGLPALPGDPAVDLGHGTHRLDLDADAGAPAEAGTGGTSEADKRSSQQRLGELVRLGVTPQLSETTRRISELVAGSEYKSILESSALAQSRALSDLVAGGAYKSILESSTLAQTTALSGFAEVLGRAAADRAAFSLASGLTASDSIASVVGKLMADTEGVGIAASALATVGESLKTFAATDLGLTASSALAAAARSFNSIVDAPGFQTALGQSEAVRNIVNGFAGTEIARTRSLAMQQLVATSGIADLIGSDRMVASWRQSLLAEATARSLIGTMAVPGTGASLLREIVAANTATARVVGRYAEANKAHVLAPAVSARPTRELRSFLSGMPVAPDLDELDFAVVASRSIAGIAAADLLVADGEIEVEAGELFEAEIVEPWLLGPHASRSLLFSRLGALDPHVPELLRGAWTQVEQNGPAATSMASHAVQEVIDRTLRALAPDELVLRLFEAGRLPKNSVYEANGKREATRAGRIAAALHERHPGETKLIAAQAKAIATSVTYLTKNLQSGKHASNGTVGLVRTWLVSVEATLTQLLYEPGDG